MTTNVLSLAYPDRVVELAERTLQSNSHFNMNNISFEYDRGVLFMRGCVPTYYLKQMAQEFVRKLAGVERVENQLEVLTPPSRSRWD